MKLLDFKGQSYLMPILILCLISGIVVVFFRLFSLKDLWYETYAAIIGVVITAVITFILLKGQTENEEEREKSLEIHKRKIEVYASLVHEIWSKLDDNRLTKEEMLEIRRKCFNELIFYLDEEQIEKITEQFKKVSKIMGKGDDKDDIRQNVTRPFEEITKILIADVDSRRFEKESTYTLLFNSFNVEPNDEKTEEQEVVPAVAETVSTPDAISILPAENVPEQKKDESEIDYAFYGLKGEEDLHEHCWNFNAYDFDIQKNHRDKLALIEYGEDWRTNKAKRVQDGDLVFLYARGGNGYRGVFRAKNIAYDGKNDSPTLVFDATKESEADYDNKGVASFDIYDGYADGATLCTAINVEQLDYYEEGVGSPIGIRRRTIDPFHNIEDVKALLHAFDEERKKIFKDK